MDKELQQDWFGEDLLPEGPVLTTNSEHVNIQAFDQDTLYQEDVLWEAELEDTTERINSLIRALGVHDEPIIRTPISSSDRNEGKLPSLYYCLYLYTHAQFQRPPR